MLVTFYQDHKGLQLSSKIKIAHARIMAKEIKGATQSNSLC